MEQSDLNQLFSRGTEREIEKPKWLKKGFVVKTLVVFFAYITRIMGPVADALGIISFLLMSPSFIFHQHEFFTTGGQNDFPVVEIRHIKARHPETLISLQDVRRWRATKDTNLKEVALKGLQRARELESEDGIGDPESYLLVVETSIHRAIGESELALKKAEEALSISHTEIPLRSCIAVLNDEIDRLVALGVKDSSDDSRPIFQQLELLRSRVKTLERELVALREKENSWLFWKILSKNGYSQFREEYREDNLYASVRNGTVDVHHSAVTLTTKPGPNITQVDEHRGFNIAAINPATKPRVGPNRVEKSISKPLDMYAASRSPHRIARDSNAPDDDVITGTNESDVIAVLSGNDVIYGLGGNDIIYGGLGNDRLYSFTYGWGSYGRTFPAIKMAFEGPNDTQSVASLGVIRGWAFDATVGQQIKELKLFIDNTEVLTIPCCSPRGDVQAGFPQFLAQNTLNSGWGTVVNWGALESGLHLGMIESPGAGQVKVSAGVGVLRGWGFTVEVFRLNGLQINHSMSYQESVTTATFSPNGYPLSYEMNAKRKQLVRTATRATTKYPSGEKQPTEFIPAVGIEVTF